MKSGKPIPVANIIESSNCPFGKFPVAKRAIKNISKTSPNNTSDIRKKKGFSFCLFNSRKVFI